jgi:hypothetical protein
MDTEEVVVAEVEDEDQHEEPPQESLGGRRRITAGPIIAIVVVVIILSGIGYYFLSGDQVNDIMILEPENVSTGDDQRYGIELEMHITGGMRPVDGTGKLEIIYDGQVAHTRDVDISSDSGSTIIDYKDFVIENGVYDIRFSMGGKSATTEYIAKMVPNELDIALQYQTDQDSEEVITMAVVTPAFNYTKEGTDEPDPLIIGDSLFYYNWNYDLETILTPPVGEPIVTQKSMWEYHRNKTYTNVRIPVDGEHMGNYTFSARLINNLVKDGSPHKELTSEPEELAKYLNRAPEMGDISQPSRVRMNQEVTFTLRATDPDANGEILFYSVTWDYYLNLDEDEDTVSENLETFMIPPGESTTIRVKHTFTETGTFPVLITCADNGYVGYKFNVEGEWVVDGENFFQKHDSTEINVLVTRI